MVRPGRERLRGAVEVDEAYWGAPEEGAVGRLTDDKALIAVAVEEDRDGIGRIRLHRIPNLTRATLYDFIAQSIEPGSIVRTDGLPAYLDLVGYVHDRKVQRDQPKGEHLLPRAHRVISLFKRWLMGTHQGAIGHDHLDDYLNEFVFRFNRRKSASRGKLFFRLAQQAVQVAPVPYAILVTPQHVAAGGVK
jgi:transposase-like protein